MRAFPSAVPNTCSDMERACWPVRVFLVVGTASTLALCALVPPLQVADEHAHFIRACSMADGAILPIVEDRRIGAPLPNAVANEAWAPFFGLIFHPERHVGRADFARLWNVRADNTRRFMDFPNMACHGLQTYGPQVAGIMVARLFTDRPLAWFYAGRLANALVWLLLMTLAVRIAPTGRWLLAALALAPVSVFQAASLSQDASVNGWNFLLFACLLRLASETRREWSWVRVAGLTLMQTIVAAAKFVYAPLLLLALPAWWRSSASGARRLRIGLLAFGVPVIATLVWLFLVRHGKANYADYHPAYRDLVGSIYDGTDPLKQVHFILMHPLRALGLFARNAMMYRLPERYLGWLGWDIVLPRGFDGALLLGLVMLALADVRSATWPHGLRWWMAGAALASVLALYLAAFVFWSPPGPAMTDLIHGRYLLPMSPALFFMLGHARAQVRPAWKAAGFMGLTLLGWLVMFPAIWMRFYG